MGNPVEAKKHFSGVIQYDGHARPSGFNAALNMLDRMAQQSESIRGFADSEGINGKWGALHLCIFRLCKDVYSQIMNT